MPSLQPAGRFAFPAATSWPPTDDVADRWDLDVLGDGLDGLASTGTASVVVLDHGALVAERHWGPDGTRQLDDVASVQKSLIAVLVGVAVDRGLLRPTDAVVDHLDAGWSRADAAWERAVTVHHLLAMTSGLSPMLESGVPAGTAWSYNTLAYQMLKPVLEVATGMSLHQLTDRWLAEPLGMTDTSWVERPPLALPATVAEQVLVGMRSQGWGQDADGRWAHRMPDGSLVTGLSTTAADLARLGLLVAAGGTWHGVQVVSPGWIALASQPSQPYNAAYGYLFWLGGRAGSNAMGVAFDSFEASAPGDLVAARGANQQLVDVSPSLGIVVARTALPGAGLRPAGINVASELWSTVRAARGPSLLG